MKNIIIIAKKEWRGYFGSPVGYVFAGLMLVVSSWIFWSDIFLSGMADIKPLIMTITFLFSIFVPAITMGMIADEKKGGNWEVLMSLPLKEVEVVVGKLVGASAYLVFTLCLTLPSVISVFMLGKPDLGVIISSYVGLTMLGMAYLAIGIFMSSLSNTAIVGFLGSAVFLILNGMMGNDMLLSRLPTELRAVTESLSLSARVSKFGDGLITLSDFVFLMSFVGVFIILTLTVLKANDK